MQRLRPHILLLLMLSTTPALAQFDYPGFASFSGLVPVGSAQLVGGGFAAYRSETGGSWGSLAAATPRCCQRVRDDVPIQDD